MRKFASGLFVFALTGSAGLAQPFNPGGGSNLNPAGVVTGQTLGVVAPIARPLAQRAADTFNVRDYGALGTNSQTTVGTTGCFASFAAFSGSGCYPWATNPGYGLTFSVTIPSNATQPSGSTNRISFLQPAQTWYAGSVANTARWQFEDSGNAPVVGMVVSNGASTTCVPAGATVTGVGADPNGTFSTSGVAYGSITLSANLTAACAAGNTINFTISTTQLQSLTQDWLGIQNTVANAESQTSIGVPNTSTVISQNTNGGGAKIFFPPGVYYINHPILYSSTSGSQVYPTPSVSFEGDNWVTSAITVPSSAPMMGFDACVFQPNNWNSSSQINFSHLLLSGGGGAPVGSFPDAYKGFCLPTGSSADNITANNFYAGLVLRENHDKIRNSQFTYNGYGVYFTNYTNTNGNISIKETNIVSNLISAIGIATTNQIDASDFDNLHAYGNPFVFYREPKFSNVKTTTPSFLSNSQVRSVYIEQTGNAYIYVDGSNSPGGLPDSNATGNIFLGGYNLDVGEYTNSSSPTTSHVYSWWAAKASPGPIYLQSFIGNTMIGTVWGYPAGYPASFTGTNSALLSASSNISNNMWINDSSFVISGTPTLPSINVTPNISFDNKFDYSSASGEFYEIQYGQTISAGAPVSITTPNSFDLTLNNYTPGNAFFGVAAVNSGSSNAFAYAPIIKKGTKINLLTSTSSGALSTPQLLYPTSGGFSPTFSTGAAVAVVYYPSAGNGALIAADLDPAIAMGGPVTQLGQTAAGTNASGAFAIVSDFTEFSGGAANSGFILNANLPPGRGEKICNDTSVTLIGYPPSGAHFGASTSSANLSAGACATYTKMSATQWSLN